MRRVVTATNRLISADDGQDLIEYALLATFIAIALIFSVTSLGGTINAVWQPIAQNV